MNKYDFNEICSEILKKSREDANLSQKEMAKRIDRSIKTIQNWETAYSVPDIQEAVAWFEACESNILRYFLDIIYPSTFKSIDTNSTDTQVKDALFFYLNNVASPDEIRKIAFCIFGNTGSSWRSQLDMITAHNHLPMKCRVPVAAAILTQYEIEEANSTLINTNQIKPDIDNLRSAIEAGKSSALKGINAYNKTQD